MLCEVILGYIIVSGTTLISPKEIENIVTKKISEGYQVHGSLACNRHGCYQPMLKCDKPKPKEVENDDN